MAAAGIDIYATPIVPPPLGVESNFDWEWTGVQVATVVVFGVTFSLATLSLLMRYYTGAFIVRTLEIDAADLLVIITISWGMSLAYFVSVSKTMAHGWGQHAWDVSIAEATQYYTYLLPVTLTYIWGPTLTKLAILCVLHRINSALWFRASIYFVSFTLIAYTVTFTGLLGGPCNPLNAGAGTCLNNIAIAQCALNIFSDLAVLAIPIPTILQLHMVTRQKLVLGSLLSLGSAVLVASIVRAPYIRILATSTDFSYKQAEAGVWSLVELNIGIMCNNMMRLKPFAKTVFPTLFAKLGFSSSSSPTAATGGKGTNLHDLSQRARTGGVGTTHTTGTINGTGRRGEKRVDRYALGSIDDDDVDIESNGGNSEDGVLTGAARPASRAIRIEHTFEVDNHKRDTREGSTKSGV